jgi:hypothetical protein
VTTAVHLSRDPRLSSHDQRTDAFRSVHLVRGHTHQVDPVALHAHRNLPECLHCVGVKEHALRMAQRADLGHGLDHSNLVVGIHHAHHDGVRASRAAQFVQVDESVALRFYDGDLGAVFFEMLAGVEHGLVFGGDRHDVPASTRRFDRALERQIVRFGGAAREDHVARRGPGKVRNLPAGHLHRALRFPSVGVAAAGGVTEFRSEIGQHESQHTLIHGSGCVVIQIHRCSHVDVLYWHGECIYSRV